jgi:hypothetical protein
VLALLQVAAFAQQLHWRVSPARQALYKAHKQALRLAGICDEGGDLGPPQGDASLQPPMSVNQIVDLAIERLGAPGDGNRLLQSNGERYANHR